MGSYAGDSKPLEFREGSFFVYSACERHKNHLQYFYFYPALE